MKPGITLLRAVVGVAAVLTLGACGPMSPEDGAPVEGDSLVESKAGLGMCPGYDSCANFSPWYNTGATSCGESTTCGYIWVCDNYCLGAGAEPTEAKLGGDSNRIPVCDCGSPYQQGKPTTFAQQERYRYCYNAVGQGCTDYEYQYVKSTCGC